MMKTEIENSKECNDINNSNNKPNETFNAKIDVDEESINDVLSYFNKIYNIKHQTHNNKIIIN